MSPATGHGIQFERYQGDLSDPDRATAETVACMCKYIAEAQNDPAVWDAAKQAQAWGRPADGAFWWCKHAIKFVQDDVLIQNLLNELDQLELLVTPSVMVRSSKPQGDCDDFTMMVCALLKCLGLGFEIVTVAADGSNPDQFSHVFCRAILSDGNRIPLDASHGKYPGWCVPASRTYRIQVWDESGRPIKDAGSKWNGLHGFVAGRGMGSLGACLEYDDSGNCLVDDGGSVASGGDTGCPSGLVMLAGQCVVPGATVSTLAPPSPLCPSGLVMMGNPGTCVPPGTTVTSSIANGVNTTTGFANILSSIFGAGGQIANAALKPAVPAGSVAIPMNSFLMYGGLALFAVLAISLVSKK